MGEEKRRRRRRSREKKKEEGRRKEKQRYGMFGTFIWNTWLELFRTCMDFMFGESQVRWDWVKASRDLEAMTWEEFRELFMSKFFQASTRHTKAREFLELKQRTITILEYVAKFTKLARFVDDYVATDIAKVQKFEDGLKLSIWGKIVGFLLQDMDLMVKTTMVIEREVDDTRNIRDTGVKDKMRES